MKNHTYNADDFLTHINEVKAVRKNSSHALTRYRDYRYLEAVYELYGRVRSNKRSELAMAVIADDLGQKINRDTHLIRAIIDATCKVDPKMKSRWTRALTESNITRTNSTDFPRVQASSSRFVLPLFAEMASITAHEISRKSGCLVVGAVGIEPTTSPV
jgi:hypothetical protein